MGLLNCNFCYAFLQMGCYSFRKISKRFEREEKYKPLPPIASLGHSRVRRDETPLHSSNRGEISAIFSLSIACDGGWSHKVPTGRGLYFALHSITLQFQHYIYRNEATLHCYIFIVGHCFACAAGNRRITRQGHVGQRYFAAGFGYVA